MPFKLISDEYKFRTNFQCKNNLWEKVLKRQEKLRLKTRNDVIEQILIKFFENEEKNE